MKIHVHLIKTHKTGNTTIKEFYYSGESEPYSKNILEEKIKNDDIF